RPPFAQVAGERAGVDAADADHALGGQPVGQRAGGPPAGGDACRVAHDVAGDPDPVGLVVLVVDPGVADVRGGLHHHLPVVGRVGERLLVAGHAGGEDRLAERLPDRTERLPVEAPPVLQHQDRRPGGACGGGRAHRVAFPSSTVGWPRRKVATTRPGRVMPAYGVLRLRLASWVGSTVTRAAGSTRVRLAGAPGAGSWPWSSSPASRAGVRLIRSAMRFQSGPNTSSTTDRAVCSPSMPGRAAAHSHSLSSTVCGAWSVATASITPSRTACRSAATSRSGRSGGLTLYTGS